MPSFSFYLLSFFFSVLIFVHKKTKDMNVFWGVAYVGVYYKQYDLVQRKKYVSLEI